MKWESRSSGLSPSRSHSLRPSARAEREGRLDWATGQKNRRPGLGRGLRVPVPCAARCPAPGAGCARRAGAEGRRLRCGPSRHHVPAPGRVSAPVPLCPRPSPSDGYPASTSSRPARLCVGPAAVAEALPRGETRRGEGGAPRGLAGVRCGSRGRSQSQRATGWEEGAGLRGAGRRQRSGCGNLAQPGHFSGLALNASPRERKALGRFGRQRHPVRHRRLQPEGPGSAAGAHLRGC